MDSLHLRLENCYGIQSLEHDFDFRENKGPKNGRCHAIYAPNGFFKTSLAKVFTDLKHGRDSGDYFFPHRQTQRDIFSDTGEALDPESLLIIDSYVDSYQSENISLLLVNNDLKKVHDDALSAIQESRNVVNKELARLAGVKGRQPNVEHLLKEDFGVPNVYDAFELLGREKATSNTDKLEEIVYTEIFNDKTNAFLESGEIQEEINQYIERYNVLVDQSPVLTRQFNTRSVDAFGKSLSESGFFQARHTLNLKTADSYEIVADEYDFKRKVDEEKDRIVGDEQVKSAFEKIDKSLGKNAELRVLRDRIAERPDVIQELHDPARMRQRLWVRYAQESEAALDKFLQTLAESRGLIEHSRQQAREEQTRWAQVVEEFNRRFWVPFRLRIGNQEEAVLLGEAPEVIFEFVDGEERVEVAQDELQKGLSQGEKRALYILNVLFEVQARMTMDKKTLLVLDDLADSFDYRNKYAIVEYLREVAEDPRFHCIFMSHNYDFHRTVVSRLDIPRENVAFATRSDRGIALPQEKYQNQPLSHWRRNLSNNVRMLVASIPLARNIAEYCGDKDELLRLTSLLHLRPDTDDFTVYDYEQCLRRVFSDQGDLQLEGGDRAMTSVIKEVADAIAAENAENAELESKVALAIATRLEAERFMIREIDDAEFVGNITRNQTMVLLKRFKSERGDMSPEVQVLKRVNLMTPENIHLNSFMYEPILDMAPYELKVLYEEVCGLGVA